MHPNTVFLVEDEPFVAMTVEDSLQSAGFQVVIANSGTEAIDMLAAMDGQPVALVTDIRLPGVLGWDVARHARQRNAELPVVYISGDSGADWRAQGVENSVFLDKPFSLNALTAAVTSLVGSR